MQLILDNWCSLNFEASSLVASQLVQLYQDRLDSHHWLFDETSPAMWMALFAFCRRMCYTEFRLALTMGSGTMDRVRFRDWFLRIDELTAEQCRKVVAVLSDPPEGEASLATIELGGDVVSRGKSRGLCRYRCKSCGRTFGTLHIQTVNSRHSQIKGFRGIATKHLDSCLKWFHLVVLGRHPSPRARACLAAAIARPSLRFAN